VLVNDVVLVIVTDRDVVDVGVSVSVADSVGDFVGVIVGDTVGVSVTEADCDKVVV
jgi:hypothetical protein